MSNRRYVGPILFILFIFAISLIWNFYKMGEGERPAKKDTVWKDRLPVVMIKRDFP